MKSRRSASRNQTAGRSKSQAALKHRTADDKRGSLANRMCDETKYALRISYKSKRIELDSDRVCFVSFCFSTDHKSAADHKSPQQPIRANWVNQWPTLSPANQQGGGTRHRWRSRGHKKTNADNIFLNSSSCRRCQTRLLLSDGLPALSRSSSRSLRFCAAVGGTRGCAGGKRQNQRPRSKNHSA